MLFNASDWNYSKIDVPDQKYNRFSNNLMGNFKSIDSKTGC